MIRSCQDKETEKLLQRRFSKKFAAIEKSARVRLELLDAATSLNDMKLPGLLLQALKGDRRGQYSLRINDRYESVLSGATEMPMMSKLWITIRENQYAW